MTLMAPVRGMPPLCDVAAARRVFRGLAGEARELVALAYVDAAFVPVGFRHMRSPGRDWAELPLREIAADALAFAACGVVVAHTHPGGCAEPSAADIAVTRRLIGVLHPLDIRVVDHLVIARDTSMSFVERGLL